MHTVDVGPRRGEVRRVAAATRKVIERLVATKAPVDALRVVAEHVEAAVAELEAHPQGRLYEGFAESALAGGAPAERDDIPFDPEAFAEHSPVIGAANPLAPPVRLEVHGDKVVGTARFGAAYEGPPSSVHGGYVACAFDELLGMVQSISGTPGMTGTLTIRYRRPTPLNAELFLEGAIDRREGRKLFCSGRIHDDSGEVTAEAEGIFIAVDFTKIAELMERRGDPPAG
jgi:acyl-coenzyme A thioesterase PaaI-like protein